MVDSVVTSPGATGSTGGATTPSLNTPDPMMGKNLGNESNLSNWAGPTVTNMLGRAVTQSQTPYEAYTGPLTAGSSNLQNQAFSGLAGLTIPTDKMGAFTPQSFNAEQAQNLMNPYLEASLNPQIEAARRNAAIQRVTDAGRLTTAGGYGGGRQAIMESENNRALMDKLASITGTGYKQAYDTAMGQFNTEQDRAAAAQGAANTYGLSALQKQADLGATQRDIESQGIEADKKQFEEERAYPYKNIQWLESLLKDMPITAQSTTYQQPSALSTAASTSGGVLDLYDRLFNTSTK
jgi:hypothetical protein